MSERIPHHINSEAEKTHESSAETLATSQEQHERLKTHHSAELQKHTEAPTADIELIKKRVSHEALTRHEAASKAAERSQDKHEPTIPFMNAEIMSMSYKRAMVRVRKQLSLPDKALSYVVHQPVINAISELGSKTIARPSGIFGGGIMALVGTTIYYWIAKHYGYDYNFTIFLALVAIGFALGLSTELLLKIRLLFRKSRN